MRISRIQVENFRSVKHADIAPSEFNVFVGQNNHGKTNLFEAIEWFYNGTGDMSLIAHLRDKTCEVSVEIDFVGIQAGIETVKNEKTKESFKKFANGRDSIRVIRRKSDGGKRSLWDEDKQEWSSKNFAGFDKAFNDCLPRLEYVATTTQLDDVSKYGKKTPIGLMLSGVLTAILERSPNYIEFRKQFDEVFGSKDSDIRVTLDDLSGKVKVHLAQQFPDCTKVDFDIAPPAFDDLLKTFETTVNDGVVTKAEEKGDGMQRALMLAIIKTYSDYRRETDELGKRFIFLIDEAELHLHPSAQRQLKDALLLLADNGDQILINTHSSVLVSDQHPKQTIFSVEKKSAESAVSPVTETGKPQVIFDLLGGSPADLLFPHNFMIVEGRTEFELLTRVIKRFYPDRPRVQIIFAEGDSEKQRKSMDAINVAFTPLNQTPVYKTRLVIFCDQPNLEQKKSFEEFKKAYPHLEANQQLHLLPESAIEETYPAKWKKGPNDVKKMTAREKTDLGKEVGDTIAREDFETFMPTLYAALQRAWELAHQ